MEKEENVYATTEGAGEEILKENGGQEPCRESAPMLPSKFKDVDALARAYSALQAEFTRRSQRLKELEKKVENFEEESGWARLGVEKLRNRAQARRAEEKRFDEFLAETESAQMQARKAKLSTEKPTEEQPSNDVAEEVKSENGGTVYEMNALTPTPAHSDGGVQEENKTEVVQETNGVKKQAQGWEEPSASVAGNEPKVTPSDTLYAQVCRDEGVRLRIIGEYLTSLGKSGAPLMTGGVGAFTTPPKKAASFSEAGDMALAYFKKPLSR